MEDPTRKGMKQYQMIFVQSNMIIIDIQQKKPDRLNRHWKCGRFLYFKISIAVRREHSCEDDFSANISFWAQAQQNNIILDLLIFSA